MVLYRRLLGAGWTLLDPNVRAMHDLEGPRRAAGAFSIRHGSSLAARLLIFFARLPPAGLNVPLTLTIIPRNGGELWRRSFNGHAFVTRQSMEQTKLLVEDIGAIRVHYQLRALAGALLYRQVGIGLHLFGLRLPLPAWAVPRIVAREWSEGDGSVVRVHVLVRHPLCGLVIDYAGSVRMECPTR